LLRVHGSLLWSLGKIITTPEVPRVYVGSFRNEKNSLCENLDLIQREEKDLLQELFHLPSNHLISKINLVARRCRQVRVHALITSYLKEHSSHFWFRVETQKHEMIEHLEHLFHEISRLNPDLVTFADFPNVQIFQQQLEKADWSTFHQLKPHDALVEHVNELLEIDLSNLIHEVRYQSQADGTELNSSSSLPTPPPVPLPVPPPVPPLLGTIDKREAHENEKSTGKIRGKYHAPLGSSVPPPPPLLLLKDKTIGIMRPSPSSS
jgi:hypothetical protein